MFNSSFHRPIVASIGFNDGANKGFWRIQPRDDEGQWIEMGADVLSRFRTGEGNLVVATAKGVYVGPSGKPGMARVLIRDSESGLVPGIYEFESRNLQQFKAIIPESEGTGAGARKDKFGRPVKTLEDSKLPDVQSLLAGRQDITPEDERLAKGELTPEEKEAEQDGRAKSPIADLPAGFEAENPDKVKELLRESGVDPDEFDKSASTALEEDPELKKKAEEAFKGRIGRDPNIPNAYGVGNAKDFKDLPDGTILDQYDRAQFYPSPKDYEGPRGKVDRQIIKQDGKWYALGKNGKPTGKPLNAPDLLDQRVLADSVPKADVKEGFDKKKVAPGEKALPINKPKEILDLEKADPKDLNDKELQEVIDLQKAVNRNKLISSPALEEAIRRAEAGNEKFKSEIGRDFRVPPHTTTWMEVDASEIAAKRAFEDAYYGETPNLDDLIEKAKTEPVEVSLEDLKPGDVISIGKMGEKTVTKVEPRFGDNIDIFVDDFGSEKKISRDPLPAWAKVKVISRAGEGSKKPEKPTATRTSTPAPEVPTTKPKPKPKSEKVKLPQRRDNGKDVAPAAKSPEELRAKKIDNLIDDNGNLVAVLDDKGKPKTLQDPNAIVDALLEENPNARIKDNGTIVMERGSFTDTDGKKYKYEVGVQRTVGNQFMERYTISDPKTGEVIHDYYNYDYKDSFASLYGKANGLVKTRDFLLGRDVPGKKGLDADGVPIDKELRSYFGPENTIENRLKYLTKKYGAGKQQRLITPEDNNRRFLDGHGRLINQVDGTVARSFVDDIYETISRGDNEVVKDAFVQAMGRMPDTPESKDALIRDFAAGLKERFAGKPEYAQLKHLPRQLNRMLEMEDLDIRDVAKIPFVSQDGVSVITPGSMVEFFNNEGASGIGRVIRLIPGSGKNGGYKDTAVVQFKDQTVNNLQTRNMKMVDETDLTNYVPKLTREELREARIKSGELRVDYNGRFFNRMDDPDYNPEADDTSSDAGAPYLGEAGVEGGSEESPAESGTKAEDLREGDPIYDENGNPLGKITAIETVPSADGGEDGYAITYETPDGEEEIVVLDAGEVRGPK